MPKYKVTIDELATYVVEVPAPNEQAARKFAIERLAEHDKNSQLPKTVDARSISVELTAKRKPGVPQQLTDDEKEELGARTRGDYPADCAGREQLKASAHPGAKANEVSRSEAIRQLLEFELSTQPVTWVTPSVCRP
jgi:hypothetical protein